MSAISSDYSRSIFATTTRTARISDSGRERQTGELAPQSQVTSFLMCDWEGCTTGTIGCLIRTNLASRKRPHSSILYIYRYTAWAFLRKRFLALEGEGITWTGQPSRQGIARFVVRIEFWRSAGVECKINVC